MMRASRRRRWEKKLERYAVCRVGMEIPSSIFADLLITKADLLLQRIRRRMFFSKKSYPLFENTDAEDGFQSVLTRHADGYIV